MLTIHADDTTELELIKLLNNVKLQSPTLSLVIVERTPGPVASRPADPIVETGPRITLRDQVASIMASAKTPLTTNDVTARVRQSGGKFAGTKSTTVYNTLRLAKLRGDVTYDRRAETWALKESKSK